MAISSPPKASRVRSRYHFDPPKKLSEPRNPGAIGRWQLGQLGMIGRRGGERTRSDGLDKGSPTGAERPGEGVRPNRAYYRGGGGRYGTTEARECRLRCAPVRRVAMRTSVGSPA